MPSSKWPPEPGNWEEAMAAYDCLVGPLDSCVLCGRRGDDRAFYMVRGFRVGNAQVCLTCSHVLAECACYASSGEFFRWPNRPRERGRRSRPTKADHAMRVYRRDGFRCRYCGQGGGDLTIDHVDPEGGNGVENLATACRSCNSAKNRRTPSEAGMALRAG